MLVRNYGENKTNHYIIISWYAKIDDVFKISNVKVSQVNMTLTLKILVVSACYLVQLYSIECIKSNVKHIGSVTFNEKQQTFSVHETVVANAVAWGSFEDKIFENGWSYLEINTDENYDDVVQAYAAGFLEGHITNNFIFNQWINTAQGFCDGKYETCEAVSKYLSANAKWLAEQFTKEETDPYWHQVRLIVEQLQGLEDGYMNTTVRWNPTRNVLYYDSLKSDFGFLFFQIGGDLEDLESAVVREQGVGRSHDEPLASGRMLGTGSCSALVKLLPNNTELFVAHDTWSFYQSMLRVMKRYHFNYHLTKKRESAVIPGHDMSFTSYPGTLFSMDDYYVTNTGLVVTETTIGNGNPARWKYVTPVGSVLEWIRNLVANRLATTGPQWATMFKKYNSGTYNNQWMVVDYKQFTPGKKLSKGVLTVLEQLPGMVVWDDLTPHLDKYAYWPSYNAPYFKQIFNASGVPAMVKKYGDWFSYDRTPRALIFKKRHSAVTDIDGMLHLMRYNQFTSDPLSRCNCTPPYSAENAIAARSDLNPKNGSYPFAALGHRSHGATDTKVTGYALMKRLQLLAISSPTYDDQPAFQWSKADFRDTTPHLGHPDLWNFTPVIHAWDNSTSTVDPPLWLQRAHTRIIDDTFY